MVEIIVRGHASMLANLQRRILPPRLICVVLGGHKFLFGECFCPRIELVSYRGAFCWMWM